MTTRAASVAVCSLSKSMAAPEESGQTDGAIETVLSKIDGITKKFARKASLGSHVFALLPTEFGKREEGRRAVT